MRQHSCMNILALLLATIAAAAGGGGGGGRAASHSPGSTSQHSSDQTITLSTTGAAPPEATAPSTQHPIFTSHGPIGHSGGWLRALTRPGALRPGTVAVVDEEFHGKREFGLPMAGRLQGVLVTSLADNSSHMVAVKASFAGHGAEGDSLRFFGVRRDDQEESHIAVVGGTGRYHGATGFAVVRAASAAEMNKDAGFSRALSFTVHLK
ncbi:hypothetical protein ACP4OV_019740 [Aristida adscensionis]